MSDGNGEHESCITTKTLTITITVGKSGRNQSKINNAFVADLEHELHKVANVYFGNKPQI
jgi:predicted secreted protein